MRWWPGPAAVCCLFDRPHHQRIARVLARFDVAALTAHRCWFGGGTALALRLGEYRESVDIDFLTSDPEGWRSLRAQLQRRGLAAVSVPANALASVRELRADAYGVRGAVAVDGIAIKIEFIREARISLDTPGAADHVDGVPCLNLRDLAASKLLANSDRWADDGTFSLIAVRCAPALDRRAGGRGASPG